MEILGQIGAFIEGLKSVVNVSDAVRSTLAGGLADGIESGTARAIPMIAKTMAGVALFGVGVLFVAYGGGMALEGIVKMPGAGYAIVGVVFGLVGLIYLKWGAKP
ncbi:Uncharacterised protein [uncultured archaeon]|nr:Uncharacterised protein [uncultured archaeon]